MTKRELNSFLKYEYSLYFLDKKEYKKARILLSERYLIWIYIKLLRFSEYYKSNHKRIRYIMNERKRNKLGTKLGFQIPLFVFKKGLKIHHSGSIVVNPETIVGENCSLHGMNCLGNKGDNSHGSPIIGSNVEIGIGALVIGDITIADGCIIGANSTVLENFKEENVVLVGTPARVIKKGKDEI